ncbi:hypothetical protein FRB99_000169 [Tulasnella sp. 403]|nr:hypothetical protein FRB99_000169 [Tulasnella sp. 403]
MESLVAPDVLSKLSQILSNLVLGENEIRKAAEQALNEDWLAKDPGNVLVALAQFTRQSPDVHFSTIYDHLPESTRKTIESLLLDCIANETVSSCRNKIIDTVTVIAEGSLDRQRPWPELQTFAAQYALSIDLPQREAAFRIFASVPRLILDQRVDDVVGVLERGLGAESADVQLAALKAATAFLSSTDKTGRERAARIMTPMLNSLIPLASSEPALFRPHLTSLITFLPPLILPRRSIGASTPTLNNPGPPSSASEPGFTYTPASIDVNSEDNDETRYAALELMVTLTESTPKSAQMCSAWIPSLVQCCLEGMAEIRDDVDGDWLERDVSSLCLAILTELTLVLQPTEESDEDGYPRAFEEALDRAACAIGGVLLFSFSKTAAQGFGATPGAPILPETFQHVPAMLLSSDWQQRHAGLMAICSVAEGTSTFMEKDLGSVVKSSYYLYSATLTRGGVLCTDLGEILHTEHCEPIMNALIATLHDPEARVHSHAAAALINLCTGASKSTIAPFLDGMIKGLLSMLNSSSKAYVQHQALTTLAMVADAAQTSFRKYYPAIFPIIKIVLKNATRKEQRVLRCRAMECGGLMALAVGKNMFKNDAPEFTSILLEIQSNTLDDDDPTNTYLMSAWARVGQTLKADFAPYLEYVMPPLLRTASIKPEMTILGDEGEVEVSSEWQTVNVSGQKVGIRTAVLEEKAFDNLVIHCNSLRETFVDYVRPVLELCLPGLRYFYHEGVRESSAMLIPMLIVCGKSILTAPDLQTVFRTLLSAINEEDEAGFLSSLYKSVVDSLLVIPPNSLPADLTNDVIATTQKKLHAIAQRRKQRTDHLLSQGREDFEDEREDIALLEELEDFVLDEVTRLLHLFDSNHPLLVVVGSVRELGVSQAQY